MFRTYLRRSIPRNPFPLRRSYFSGLSTESSGGLTFEHWVVAHAIGGGVLLTGSYIHDKNQEHDMRVEDMLLTMPFVSALGIVWVLAVTFPIGKSDPNGWALSPAIRCLVGYTSIVTYPVGAGILLWNYTKKQN